MPALLDKLQKQYKWRRHKQHYQHQQSQHHQQQPEEKRKSHYNFCIPVTAIVQTKNPQQYHKQQQKTNFDQWHYYHHQHQNQHHHYQHQHHNEHYHQRHQRNHLKQRLKLRYERLKRQQKFCNLNTLISRCCTESSIFLTATTHTTKTYTTTSSIAASLSTRRLYAAIFTLMLSIICHYSNAALQSTGTVATTTSLQLVRDFKQMPQDKPQQLSNNLNSNNQTNNITKTNKANNNNGNSDGYGYGNKNLKANFSIALESHYEAIENLTGHFRSFSIADLQRSISEDIETDLQYVDLQPIFDFGMPRNITGRKGHSEVVIKCRVDMLNDKSVSWIRKRDLHILTVGTTTYTTDKRFEVTASKDEREWTLHVKSPQKRDSGIYECQINTEPKISMAFQLNVIEIPADAKAIINGPADLHFKVGSAIVLQCLVEQPTVKDIGPIYWFRGEQIITPFQQEDNNGDNSNFDVGAADSAHSFSKSGTTTTTAIALDNANLFIEDSRTMQDLTNDIMLDFTTRISMESQLGDTLKSRLRISNAQKTDTGNYTCQPTTASSASVMVHVINDENPAAMQKSHAVAYITKTAPVSAYVCYCLTFMLA